MSAAAAPVGSLSRTLPFPAPVISLTQDGWTAVSVAGCEPEVQTAKPVLPVAGVTFEIPKGFAVKSVTVTPLRISEIPLAAPVQWGLPPRRPDDPPQPFIAPDPAIYGGPAPYPDLAQPVWRTDPSEGATLLNVQLFPVRFDPARALLIAAEALVVTVELQPAPVPALPPAAAQRGALVIPQSVLLDPGAPHSYLVISTSNLIHHTPGPWNLQALCDSRARSGFTPAIMSVEWIYANYAGTDNPAKIRAFVQDAYQQWGVRYLLIAGTFALIPAQKLYVSFADFIYTITAEIPSDAIYYGCLDGPFDNNGNGRYGEVNDGANGGDVDLTAEVMVGRFPVDSAEELSHMVRKTLRYEGASPADLAPNAFMAEKMDLGTLVYATGFMEELRYGNTSYGLDSLGFETSPYADAFDTGHTLYDSTNGLWNTKSAIDFLNRNYQSVNHIGHGAVKYCAKISLANTAYQEVLRAFTNDMPYFMYSQACDTGAFDTPDCFAEQIVTVSNAAVAAVMNARSGWEYGNVVGGHSHRYHRCFWDAALRGNATRLGEINELSRRMNLHMITSYSANYWRWVYYELNLFGDPATPFAPAVNTVAPVLSHQPLINTYDTQTAYRVACTLEPVGIYDPSAVALVWQADREPALVHTQALTQVEGNLFEGFIAPQPPKTRIAYAILARNRAGYQSRWPETGDSVFYVTDRLELTVEGSLSRNGTVSPDYGVSSYASGLVVTASAPVHVPVSEDTRFTNTGFFGTGSVPQSGTNRTVSFLIERSSLLVWLWQREHRLTLFSDNAAFPTQFLWSAESDTLFVPPVPQTLTNNGSEYAFAEWRLDGARSPAAPKYCSTSYGGLAMNAPHSLEALYLPAALDADANAIPDWWEFRYYGANGQDPEADGDQDGYTLAEEFADRSDPLVASLTPAPPRIAHTPLDATQTRPGPFTIRAAITDTHEISAALVRWHRRTEAWQTAPMSLVSNNLYEAQIGLLSAPGDDFEYQILATDPTGLTGQTDVFFFFLHYPVADTSRFHDLDVVALSTQVQSAVYMNLHNTGNADLTWAMRFARVEKILATNLPAWNWTSVGQPWEVSTNRAFSAPYALHSKLISNSAPNTPVRSSITFPPTLIGDHAVLSFKYWIYAEVHLSTTRAFDGGIVEYSVDNGLTFQQLRGPYTHTIYGWEASPWPEGTPCFAGKGTEGWQTAAFDLYGLYPEMNGFKGRVVLFRFHYGADNNTDKEGWYIDDVTVTPLLWQNGFSHSVESSYNYTISGGNYKRILWINQPSSMDVRNDNMTVFLESNAPVNPLFSFFWQIKIRDYPLLPGLYAAQTATGDGIVSLATGVYDRDGEPVSLAVQWSPDSGNHWNPAALTTIVAALGSVPSNTATGDIANLPTSLQSVPVTNQLSASWASRAVVPPIGVNSQILFRVIADNGYYSANYTTGRLTVDNVPPVFLPGALTFTPLSAVGPYAVTDNLLTLAWPAATDNPSAQLSYRLLASAVTNTVATTSVTLALSNSLDAVNTFRVVALDPAGNASAPLEDSLLVLNASGDYDADGMTTADEEIAGTSAANATDRLSAALSSGSGVMALTWQSVEGRLYTVESTPTLLPPDWQPLPDGTDVPGTGLPLSIGLPTAQPSNFFRIRVRLP